MNVYEVDVDDAERNEMMALIVCDECGDVHMNIDCIRGLCWSCWWHLQDEHSAP